MLVEKKKGLSAILTNELFHIILLLQKSCLERKESLKLKSTQMSINFRRKSSLISCFVASFFPSSQEKLIFLPILKERNPQNFSIWIYNHQKYTLLSTRSLKTNWISWCPTFFDHHRHSQQSFHSLQTVWFFPFFHHREIWKANHLFFKRFKTCT